MLLLDTDIMIDVLRGYAPALQWIENVSITDIALPGYVAMELIQGCQNQQELRTLRDEMKRFRILWPQPTTCDQALHFFGRFHLAHSTGLLDVLIGMLAVERGVPLHTFNEKHYRPIPGMETVQPYDRAA